MRMHCENDVNIKYVKFNLKFYILNIFGILLNIIILLSNFRTDYTWLKLYLMYLTKTQLHTYSYKNNYLSKL